ncbi:hypothetical protein [Dongia sp.]|uniref:hypothetical protein n=1 Tax=Dongia sp. TaxID=1977262 RepID=UPI0035AF7DD1
MTFSNGRLNLWGLPKDFLEDIKMKLNDLCAHFVPLLELPLSDFTELLRALKEQSDHFDITKYPEMIERSALYDDSGVNAEILKARAGPGGGLNADPFLAAFFLTALLVNGGRKDVAHRTWRAWHMHVAGSVLTGWGDNPKFDIKTCPLTGQHLFGNAFKVILGDEHIARTIEEIRISSAQFAEIQYDGGAVSRFEGSGHKLRSSTGVSTTIALSGAAIASIADLLKQ